MAPIRPPLRSKVIPVTDARWTAVDAVMGRVFAQGLRKPRGGGAGGTRRAAPTPALRRMSRIGTRDGAAVFKLIKSGGTTSRSGLKGQLDYVFRDDKLARVIDPTGRLDPDARPDAAQLDRLTRTWSRSWWAGTRNGNTSHMILSYPKGVSVDQVERITRDVCAQMFDDGARRFRYVAAVHDDTDHHRHAHVIVNRRADDDTLFTMRSGTEHSYEGFREAMAEHGARYGVHLDPSFRFERGETARQPTWTEQRSAQTEGRVPADRSREGVSYDYHAGLVDRARAMAGVLSVLARESESEHLADVYGALFDRLGTPDGGDLGEALRELQVEYDPDDGDPRAFAAEEMRQVEALADHAATDIARAEREQAEDDPAARALGEWRMAAMLRALTHLTPELPGLKGLQDAPQAGSIYQHGPGPTPEALHDPSVQARLTDVERDHGIPAAAVTARLGCAGVSAHLEATWIAADIRSIQTRHGLSFQDDRAEVVDRLDDAHAALRDPLVAAGAIRYLPHLDPNYLWVPPEPETYTYGDDRTGDATRVMVEHYRDAGAPQDWIEENLDLLSEDLADNRAEAQAAFLARHPNIVATLERFDDATSAPDTAPGPAETRQGIGSAFIDRYPDMPHALADRIVRIAERENWIDLVRRPTDIDREPTPGAPSPDPADRAALLARFDAVNHLVDELFAALDEKGRDDGSGRTEEQDSSRRRDDRDRDDDGYGR